VGLGESDGEGVTETIGVGAALAGVPVGESVGAGDDVSTGVGLSEAGGGVRYL
jgi:hypothetical protein